MEKKNISGEKKKTSVVKKKAPQEKKKTLVRKKTKNPPVALLGYSLETMEAAKEHDIPFVAVVPEGFDTALREDGVDCTTWDFYMRNQNSDRLYEKLLERGVSHAVPLYEETVEWAGSLNTRLLKDPRAFQRALLFRDKAMMKRNAQMNGIRVGVFEEVRSREEVVAFFDDINEARLRLDEEVPEPVHLKPLSAAGSVGHVFIRSKQDIALIPDDAFPCLVESHLAGQEFSVEVFIHKGKIQFMNITEYVHLGYSQIVPETPKLRKFRPKIEKAIHKLIKAFGIVNGMIHPEYFLDHEGELHFGEVAARVPGGHIFELIQKAHGFNPYAALLLCSNPLTTQAELDRFFPKEEAHKIYAANLMVYPRKPTVYQLQFPPELANHSYMDRHTMFEPVTPKVAERVGFGNHYGTIFLAGKNPETLRELVQKYEEYDFYV
ncbi:MAG: ATP-grasp domain-containing protein [Nitrospira sp.]|nr:ATP-grasp domain-containing protein [Nitrospira sp.]MCA9499610.1 ATP-grasp domain-containing protein [Nitrospira sp.]